ncbi:endolytic transglycosylase MltG, partial [Nonlabens mediterrranea]|nr:endolytic transglycosylase MltG [Nonlabens mediterrranea]
MNKYKNVIVGVALVGLIAMSIFAYKVYSTFFSANTNFESQTYEVFIPSIADYNAAFMIVADAVEDRDAFHETAVRKGYNSNVKPGRYILKKGMSNNDIINTIRSQNQPVKVRFNNQERLEDLAGRLAQEVEPDSLSLLNAMRDVT